MSKCIALEKLNSLLVNIKADQALSEYNKDILFTGTQVVCPTRVRLVKIVISESIVKNTPGVPFYAFVKDAGEVFVIVDVITGSTTVAPTSIIQSECDVTAPFRINGITYALKDTINGFKRYRPISCSPKKPRTPKKVDKQEVADAYTIYDD